MQLRPTHVVDLLLQESPKHPPPVEAGKMPPWHHVWDWDAQRGWFTLPLDWFVVPMLKYVIYPFYPMPFHVPNRDEWAVVIQAAILHVGLEDTVQMQFQKPAT